ncbi:MAG: sulfurtransferase TusA family protein [Halobacteria archaeon]
MAPEPIDLRGIKCPYNFIRSKKIMDSLAPGAEVHVLITDRTNLEYIRDYAKKKAIRFEAKEEGEATRMVIKKS